MRFRYTASTSQPLRHWLMGHLQKKTMGEIDSDGGAQFSGNSPLCRQPVDGLRAVIKADALGTVRCA
ncbi:hypothetical protein [Hominenteromicrobium sp.]|uniref:hypothetical protein n=1 Tax=Hominenteromicrobium sp. TaxID=3073581 RepID=UPI00399B69A3